MTGSDFSLGSVGEFGPIVAVDSHGPLARAYVARVATDADDEATLLDMLGLGAE